MAGERILEVDPFLGTKTIFHDDIHAGGQDFQIETVQDVTDILETNKGTQTHFDERAGWKGDMHKVASIPLVLYFELKKQGITDDPKRFKAWLNDADNRYFRTRPGRV